MEDSFFYLRIVYTHLNLIVSLLDIFYIFFLRMNESNQKKKKSKAILEKQTSAVTMLQREREGEAARRMSKNGSIKIPEIVFFKYFNVICFFTFTDFFFRRALQFFWEYLFFNFHHYHQHHHVKFLSVLVYIVLCGISHSIFFFSELLFPLARIFFSLSQIEKMFLKKNWIWSIKKLYIWWITCNSFSCFPIPPHE